MRLAEHPRPLGPLRDVADELGPSVSALLRGTAAQHEIFAAVLDALRARPRVFVVEDLHWADEATLDLVRFLARRIAGLPLLLVLSYRDAVGVDHPLSPVLGDLVASPGACRVQLTPLSRSAVAALVDGHGLDPADVHRRTAGNPFFLSQILAQPDAPMPASVRDAVLARTAGLAPPVRHCLELLSCTPEPVGPELLDALGVSTATVGVLATTGLIDRHGPAVAFRHEIARSAILGAAVPGSEAALHGAMIDALETVGADPSVLAHHAAAAGRRRPRPAVRARRGRRGLPLRRTSGGRRLLRGRAAPRGRRRRHPRHPARGHVRWTCTSPIGCATRSRRASRRVELRRELGEVVAVGAGHTALAGFAWYAADRALAERHAEAAIEILGATDDRRALGFALARQAFLAAQRGDAPEARRSGDRAARLADELDDDAVLRSTASIGIAVARLIDGDLGGRSRPARGHRGRPAAPARRPRDDTR